MKFLTPDRLKVLCDRAIRAATRIKDTRQDWIAASNLAIRWARWAARQNHH